MLKRPTPKAPARGEIRNRRREEIAASAIQGKPVTQIAREVGVSREWASKELHNPETQGLIRSWMEPHRAAIRRMIPKALAVIDESLQPSQDVRDRLTAVRTLGNVME